MISIVTKVESFLDSKMPRRPNGEEPRDCQPIQRDDRSRSKSRSRREHQSQRDIEVQNKWGHGEKLDKKSAKIKKLLRSAQKELQQIGTVTEELQRVLASYLGIPGLEENRVK